MNTQIKDYMLEQLKNLMAIPSPTGYTAEVQKYLLDTLKELGFEPYTINKGGVVCCLGGEENPIMLASHVDTLGAMVRIIKSNGALMVSPLGGLNPNNVETETVTVITRFNGKYEGTFQIENASSHVNKNVNAERTFDGNLEVLLDEIVKNSNDTKKLGISNGDFIAVNPRLTITEKGFIKSRFLDDKASAAVLLAIAKAVSCGELKLSRKVYINFTVYEEVGHGGAAGIPSDVLDMISVDMGCVGTGLECDETMVSICAKDSGGPYNYELTTQMIEIAKNNNLDYAVDVYPMYGSDVEASLKAGHNVRHGLIGPGVYASHGYERSHIKGLENTYKLIYNLI